MLRIAIVLLSLGAAPVELTADEFKLFRHYQRALEDPRVSKLKPSARLAAIARDSKVAPRVLEQAVARGEAAGDIKANCQAAVEEALGRSALAGRVDKVDLDTSQPHAVAYLSWRNETPGLLNQEAAIAAGTFSRACPVASTIQVWAVEVGSPDRRVFEGLISAEAAARIKLDQVKEFADSRYRRLFEKVKSAQEP